MIKLSDYGLSTRGNYVYKNKSTLWHSAPEVFKGKRELKSDVWSLGYTLVELAEEEIPYEIANWGKAKEWACDKDPPSLSSEKWSEECMDFVGKCFVKDVKERWDVKQLMEVSDGEMVKA